MTDTSKDQWEPGNAERFAERWAELWNEHDVEGVLGHFSEDVVFTSPVARRVVPDGDSVALPRETAWGPRTSQDARPFRYRSALSRFRDLLRHW